MITYKLGDMFTSEMPALGHGVNCEGVMGSGIAVTVKKNFPDVYKAYRAKCTSGSKRLQGGDMFPYQSENGGIWILNLASQYKPGKNAKYDFLIESVKAAFAWCDANGIYGFALPRIGSGIGGLEEPIVEYMLQYVAAQYPDIELELWTYPEANTPKKFW